MSGPADRVDVEDGGRAARGRWLGVEVRHLAALEAIVREGSFRGAADSLGYGQSAISQQVSYLEQLFGARLIERSRGSAPIALTEAGELLLDHVEVILSRLQAAQADLDALADGRAGVVRVGAFQSAANRLFGHVLPAFARVAPNVRVVATETQTDAPLFDLVERREVDIAFCQLPIVDGPFESVEVMEDPFVFMVSARSALAASDEAPSLAEIGAMPLIGFNVGRVQEHVLAELQARGIEPEFAQRSDLNATVQSLVAADIGAAIVPYLSVDPQHPGTSVVELRELAPRKIALVWHRDYGRTRTAELFADAVRSTCSRRFRRRSAHDA